jgi:hypothetical protein
VESSCEHGNEPSGSIKCWKFFCGFLRRAQLHEVSYVHKVKAKRLLCLIKHYGMQTCVGVEVWLDIS